MGDTMSKVRFGLIGCGAIGKIHAHVISQILNAELAIVADRNTLLCTALQSQYGCEICDDYMDILKRDDIDIVTICLPSGLHYQVVKDAAMAGKHIIVEKPMDISLEKADSMIEICNKRGVKLSVIMQHRFDEAVQLLKRTVNSGSLGKLNFGTSRTTWYRDEEYFKAASWRGTWAVDGGGALMNQSIHYIDLLQYIMGPVDAVCGKCDTLQHKMIETEDVGVALIRFKNGAIGTIEGTTLAYPGLNTELNIFGQNGTVCIKNDQLDFYKFKVGEILEFEGLLKNGVKELIYEDFNYASHKRQYEDVIDAVINNRQPLVNGEDGKKALEIIKAIYKSSQTNEWVTV